MPRPERQSYHAPCRPDSSCHKSPHTRLAAAERLALARDIRPRTAPAGPLQPQQALGVAAQNLGLVLVAQRHGFHPCRPACSATNGQSTANRIRSTPISITQQSSAGLEKLPLVVI